MNMKSPSLRKKPKWCSPKKFGKSSMVDSGALVARIAIATDHYMKG